MPARLAVAETITAAMAAVAAGALNAGALVFYADTTAAPVHATDPVPLEALELARFPLPAANAAAVATDVDGSTVTLAPLAPIAGLASGRIGWARAEDGAGAGLVLPNVGTIDEALIVSSLDVVAGDPVTVVLWAFVIPTVNAE